jgi:hypothetical protein
MVQLSNDSPPNTLPGGLPDMNTNHSQPKDKLNVVAQRIKELYTHLPLGTLLLLGICFTIFIFDWIAQFTLHATFCVHCNEGFFFDTIFSGKCFFYKSFQLIF